MVILKYEWFEGKEGSYLERYDITWQGIAYIIVMFVIPFSLCIIFPVLFIWFIVVFFPQNMNINTIALAWVIFSSMDLIDAGLAYPSLKEKIDKKVIINLIVWRNAGWGAASVLLAGVFISIIYNLHSWNFYLGLFSLALFVACMVMATTKYKLERDESK